MVMITEHELPAFRRDHLSAEAILGQIEAHVHVLLRLGIGVGKSEAADGLLRSPGIFQRFQLVIYAAPTWNIINERAIVAGREPSPVPWTTLRPRPQSRCGALNEPWEDLEGRGCAAYAKASLCRACPWLDEESDPCPWPGQFARLKGIRLVFCAEQQLVLNRNLLGLLKDRTGAASVLVILDEARLLDTNFEVTLAAKDLGRFRDAVGSVVRPHGLPGGVGLRWLAGIDALLVHPQGTIQGRWRFPRSLNRRAFKLQAAGIHLFGSAFRYLGYDLTSFPWAKAGERWKDGDGAIHFVARPYLGCHVLLLSAHLDGVYAGHRLGAGRIQSPFEDCRFQHTGTRILNLRSRMGADRYFDSNKDQILDTFAVLIRRNIQAGRSTLLISRKKSKSLCAGHLEERLAGWGIPVRFVLDGYDALPEVSDPAVIPVIHYGVLGVNDFTAYESAYCLNSLYVSTRELNRHVQDSEPEKFRVELRIVSNPDMIRRVEIAASGIPDLDHTFLGTIYLRKLEVDPVIQAAGRVRFLTKPREVVFFQMHDLHREVGEYQDVRCLAELRRAMGVPSAREIDLEVQATQIRDLEAQGLSKETIANRMGVSRTTLWRRAAAAGCFKNPLSIFIREFETQTAETEAGEAAP